MKADEIILGIPTLQDDIADKKIEQRQMPAGASVRFVKDVASYQLDINEMNSLMEEAKKILDNPTRENLSRLDEIAIKLEQFDKNKISIVKKILNPDFNEDFTEDWIINNVTNTPLLGLINRQVLLNSLGLQTKNSVNPLQGNMAI